MSKLGIGIRILSLLLVIWFLPLGYQLIVNDGDLGYEGQFMYKPPFFPIEIVKDKTGVHVNYIPEIATPIGTFGVGILPSIKERKDNFSLLETDMTDRFENLCLRYGLDPTHVENQGNRILNEEDILVILKTSSFQMDVFKISDNREFMFCNNKAPVKITLGHRYVLIDLTDWDEDWKEKSDDLYGHEGGVSCLIEDSVVIVKPWEVDIVIGSGEGIPENDTVETLPFQSFGSGISKVADSLKYLILGIDISIAQGKELLKETQADIRDQKKECKGLEKEYEKLSEAEQKAKANYQKMVEKYPNKKAKQFRAKKSWERKVKKSREKADKLATALQVLVKLEEKEESLQKVLKAQGE